MTIKVGDTVAIRGDKRMNYLGRGKWICAYTPDQLIDGKYLKHTGHGGVWTGKVEVIKDDMARVGITWMGIEMLEVYKEAK